MTDKLDQLLAIVEQYNALKSATNQQENINVPTVIIGGKQSYGKSAILNGLLNLDFNFSASGIGTLVPLHFYAKRDLKQKVPRWQLSFNGNIIESTDINRIKNFIMNENTKCRQENRVSFSEITIRLFWAKTYDLNFLDLPGIQDMASSTSRHIQADILKLYDDIFTRYEDALILIVEKAGHDNNGLGSYGNIVRILNEIKEKKDGKSSKEVNGNINLFKNSNNVANSASNSSNSASNSSNSASNSSNSASNSSNSASNLTNSSKIDLIGKPLKDVAVIINMLDILNASDDNNAQGNLTQTASNFLLSQNLEVFGTCLLKENNTQYNFKDFEDRLEQSDQCAQVRNEYHKLNLKAGFQAVRDWMRDKLRERIIDVVPKYIQRIENELQEIDKFKNSSIAELSMKLSSFIMDYQTELSAKWNGNNLALMSYEDEYKNGIRSKETDLFVQSRDYYRLQDATGLKLKVRYGGSAQLRRQIHLMKINIYSLRLPLEDGSEESRQEFVEVLEQARGTITGTVGGTDQWSDIIVKYMTANAVNVLNTDLDNFVQVANNMMMLMIPKIESDFSDYVEQLYKNKIAEISQNFKSQILDFFKEFISTSLISNDEIWTHSQDGEGVIALSECLVSNNVFNKNVNVNADVSKPEIQQLFIDACLSHFMQVKKRLYDIFETIMHMHYQPGYLNMYKLIKDEINKKINEMKNIDMELYNKKRDICDDLKSIL